MFLGIWLGIRGGGRVSVRVRPGVPGDMVRNKSYEVGIQVGG